MKWIYYTNGKGVARCYTKENGTMIFEIGPIRDEEANPCVMNEIFATYSVRISNNKELRQHEKELKKKYGDFVKILIEH